MDIPTYIVIVDADDSNSKEPSINYVISKSEVTTQTTFKTNLTTVFAPSSAALDLKSLLFISCWFWVLKKNQEIMAALQLNPIWTGVFSH